MRTIYAIFFLCCFYSLKGQSLEIEKEGVSCPNQIQRFFVKSHDYTKFEWEIHDGNAYFVDKEGSNIGKKLKTTDSSVFVYSGKSPYSLSVRGKKKKGWSDYRLTQVVSQSSIPEPVIAFSSILGKDTLYDYPHFSAHVEGNTKDYIFIWSAIAYQHNTSKSIQTNIINDGNSTITLELFPNDTVVVVDLLLSAQVFACGNLSETYYVEIGKSFQKDGIIIHKPIIFSTKKLKQN